MDVFAHKRVERHRALVEAAGRSLTAEQAHKHPYATRPLWEEVRDRLHAGGCTRVWCGCARGGIVQVLAAPLLPNDRLTADEKEQALVDATRLLLSAGYRVREAPELDPPRVLVATPFRQANLFDL